MKLKMVDIVNIYDGSKELLEKEIGIDLAFDLADLISTLRPKREAFATAVGKIKKDAYGKIDPEEFGKLLAKEIDADINPLKRDRITTEFEKIQPKLLIALYPVLED